MCIRSSPADSSSDPDDSLADIESDADVKEDDVSEQVDEERLVLLDMNDSWSGLSHRSESLTLIRFACRFFNELSQWSLNRDCLKIDCGFMWFVSIVFWLVPNSIEY